MQMLRTQDSPEMRAALAAQSQVPKRDRERLIRKRLALALIEWALRRMGRRHKGYIDRWRLDFTELTGVLIAENPAEAPVAILQQTHVPIRLTHPRGGEFLPPRSPGAGFFNVSDARGAYEAVLPGVQTIKRKRWRNDAARALAFKEALPGVPKDRLNKYDTMKASEIALDYVAWKYGLRVKADTLKRYLAAKPEAMILRLRESLSYGPPSPLFAVLARALECPRCSKDPPPGSAPDSNASPAAVGEELHG